MVKTGFKGRVDGTQLESTEEKGGKLSESVPGLFNLPGAAKVLMDSIPLSLTHPFMLSLCVTAAGELVLVRLPVSLLVSKDCQNVSSSLVQCKVWRPLFNVFCVLSSLHVHVNLTISPLTSPLSIPLS